MTATLRQIRHRLDEVSRLLINHARMKRQARPRVSISLIINGRVWI